MTDREILARRLDALCLHVERIRVTLPLGFDAFAADLDRQDIVAFNLIQALQKLVDMALHVAATEGWGVPESLGEVFVRLADEGVLERPLAQRLRAAAGMRNLLVHAYGRIDLELVHDVAKRHLGDLLAAGEALARFAQPASDAPTPPSDEPPDSANREARSA